MFLPSPTVLAPSGRGQAALRVAIVVVAGLGASVADTAPTRRRRVVRRST